jgi:outer membrane receptor for ferrienterochelin and colicins
MALLVFGLGPRRADGDERSPAPKATEPIEVVVTGTRTAELSQRATVKTDVVTREEAERRGATNVAEALASQPGVQVNPGAYGYLGTISPVRIQGFDLGRVLILEDGEPVIGDIGGAIDLASIPIADIERIEVVMGPTSALYGSSAIGGVVNIITARPRHDEWSGRARTEYRSYDGIVLQGSGAYRSQSTWAALDLGFTRQDGVLAQPELPDLRIPENERSVVGVRAGTDLAANIDLQVRARWLHQRLDGLHSQDYPGLGRYLIDQPSITDRIALHLLETIRFGGSSLRLSLGRQWADNITSTLPVGSPLGHDQKKEHRLRSFEATITLADGPRAWVAGTRLEAWGVSQQLDQRQSVGGAIVTTTQPEIVPNGVASAAAYGQLQWTFRQVFTALPGVRAEYHGTRGGAVAPRLALALRPLDTLTLRASGGRGFRTPSSKEIGFDFDHSIYGYKVIGNPNLLPEQSWGVNGDVTWKPDDRISLRAGAFMNWVDDLIGIDLGGGTTSGTVVTYTYKNFEKVRTFGAQTGATFRIGRRFRADLSYDYLWTRDDVNDVPLAGRPPHMLTTSISASLPSKLEAYARARFASDAFVDRSMRTPGYAMTDVRLACTLQSDTQAYVGVLNLLDVHQESGRVGDFRPPLGRVLYVGVRAAFPGEEN